MFHGARAEILCGQGFEKNLQQISIRATFFNSFPQIVHKGADAPCAPSEGQYISVRVKAKCRRHLALQWIKAITK
jgi:hypothetical protein